MKPIISLLTLFLFVPSLYAAEPKTVKFIISPETTYIDGPAYPDGSIDYISAINQRLSKQTTTENNVLYVLASSVLNETTSAVLFREVETDWKKDPESVKTAKEHDNYYQRLSKLLGFDVLPDLRPLVSIDPMFSLNDQYQKKDFKAELLQVYTPEQLGRLVSGVKKEEDKSDDYYWDIVYSQWRDALQRPWSEKEFPYLAAWLERRKVLTNKLIAITKQKTGYYHPLVTGTGDERSVASALLPLAQSTREVARLFAIQGNRDFTNGNIDHAFECALSSIHFGKTIRTNAGCLVEVLIGIAINGIGDNQLTIFLANLDNKKDAAWILQKKKEFDAAALHEEPVLDIPAWCTFERMCSLSMIQQIAINPSLTYSDLFGTEDTEEYKKDLKKYTEIFRSGKDYDWNEMMRQINRCYDEMEDVFAPPSLARQRNAAERMKKQIMRFSEENETDMATRYFLSLLMPAVLSCHNAFERNLWDRRITSLAFSLAAYRADHGGKNPDTLDALVPKYIESVPISPSTGKPMRYVKRQHDVLIPNRDNLKLDGSEAEAEKKIAEAQSGGRAFPGSANTDYIFVVQKNP
jgi:hypothetical protein